MKTFFMIKPDGVQRNLIGQIISRVEVKGFKIKKIKMMTISKSWQKNTMESIKINLFLTI